MVCLCFLFGRSLLSTRWRSPLSKPQLVLIAIIVSLAPNKAAELHAKPQLRRCVSLSANMDSGEQIHNLRNAVGRTAYVPAHSPIRSAVRSQYVCTGQALELEASAGPSLQRGSREYTRIQTQLFPNIKF